MKFAIVLVLAIAECVSFANTRVVSDVGINGSDENVYGEVTYPGIGTFTTKDFYDIKHRPIVYLPQSPEHINTHFLLHTRKNLKDHQILKVHDLNSIRSSNFNGSNPTKFIAHGFDDNQLFGQWMRTIIDEFLRAGDYNVVIVDWSGGNSGVYGQATANTRVVGPVIAMLVEDLKNATDLDLSSVHILGHSLGAHVAGYAGKRLNKVGRITGLDPAGPYFEGLPPAGRLDKTDAEFVDVIHTDARHLLPDFGFGTYDTLGHIDFYPNGGKVQPGCDQERVTKIFTDGLIEGVRRLVACNHQRAVDFFIESIDHKQVKPVAYECEDFDSFTAGKCTDCGTNGEKCAVLGHEADSWTKFKDSNSGKRFFLRTGEHSPFFKYEYEIRINFSEKSNHADQSGVMYVTLHGPNAEDKLQLNHNVEALHLGRTYNFVVITGYDFGDISKLTFRWHNPLGLVIHTQLYIDSINVVPLTSSNIMDRQKHLTEIKTFCNKSPNQGIENEKNIDFDVICK